MERLEAEHGFKTETESGVVVVVLHGDVNHAECSEVEVFDRADVDTAADVERCFFVVVAIQSVRVVFHRDTDLDEFGELECRFGIEEEVFRNFEIIAVVTAIFMDVLAFDFVEVIFANECEEGRGLDVEHAEFEGRFSKDCVGRRGQVLTLHDVFVVSDVVCMETVNGTVEVTA